MHVISRLVLRQFAARYPDAKAPLDAWFKCVSAAEWQNLAQLRSVYPSADPVGRLVVFNIGGNKYRLIGKVTYARHDRSGTVYIRRLLTHAQYDTGDWKNDAWF